MAETHVVTCFLRNRGEVLLFRRSEEVGSYTGRWGAVSGHAEGDPDAAAREEIAEESGLLDACTLVRSGEPFSFTDSDLETRWVVHPYLFDCDARDVETDWETAEAEWTHPTDILRRETVPRLWTSYERVAPSVGSVRGDDDHGSAYVSVRAMEVLRDRAGELAETDASDSDDGSTDGGDRDGRGGDDHADGDDGRGDHWSDLAALADDLLDARPSMAALGNRVNRVVAEASEAGAGGHARTAEAVERAARAGIDRAFRVDERAAANAAAEIRNGAVLTLSRSGTALDALGAADEVFVAESRPAREGVGVAEALAATADGPDVTLLTDAAIARVLATEEVDAVVVGADAVLPDGRVVNKTGTRGAALAAAREGVPVYAVAASDKVRTDGEARLESGDPSAVYDGQRDVTALNPTFDVTPADLVSAVVTERGALDSDGIAGVAAELCDLAGWREVGRDE